MTIKLNVGINSPTDVAVPVGKEEVVAYLETLIGKMKTGNPEGNYGVTITSGLTQASATITCASAVTTADTVTIAGQALTGIVQRATATAACVTVLATQTLTVNGRVFTAVDSAPTTYQFLSKVGGTTDTGTAASLVTQVNAASAAGDPLLFGIRATSSTDTVTFRAVTAGTAGNSFTLAKSDATITISGATFAGGIAVANNQWDTSPGTTFAQAAADIARCINASTTAAILNSVSVVTLPTAAVVTVTAKANFPGTAGNGITLVSSNGTRLAVTGSGYLASGATSVSPVSYLF